MDYRQARAFYEKTASFGSVMGLDSIERLMKELGEPYKYLKIVHIAGTNGKGSASCFLAFILRQAGILTGQFNSPAVFDVLETIQVNGVPIEKEVYALHMERIQTACEAICGNGFAHPTEFEIELSLALLYFATVKCEIVLLETGMGGALDATNIVKHPLCSVFVSISMDHMQFLGETIEEIAKVKSGIIKYKCPVVSVHQQGAAESVLRQKAEEMCSEFYPVSSPQQCSVNAEGGSYEYPGIGFIETAMAGICQIENSACAAETALLLKKLGYPITANAIRTGIKNAQWPGRFERISETPLFFIDGAHNANAAVKLKQTLEYSCDHRKILYIMGVMKDKEYGSILEELLPYCEKVFAVTPDQPRALSAHVLAQTIQKMGKPAEAFDYVSAAVEKAYRVATEDKSRNTMILAFGSLYYLKEVKIVLYEIKRKERILNQELLKGKFGIEKESLRIDTKGWLAETEHPFFEEESISRDFGEAQVEFISDAREGLFDSCSQICSLQNMVEERIWNREKGREYIWTYSNPPYFRGEEGILIADFNGDKTTKTNYREYLSDKYGKVKMLYSGVHFNYSVSDAFLEELKALYNCDDVRQVKNEWYVKLADRLMNDSWLLVALTAASPTADPDFLRAIGVPEEEFHAYASFRNSPYGYWNQFEPELSYNSFDEYCDSIEKYIKDGSICSIQELYYPIRLKPVGENSLDSLRESGVNHIELRMLDLNPLVCSGVGKKDLAFIHLLIGFRMHEMLKDTDFSVEFSSDDERIKFHKEAAQLDFLDQYEGSRGYALKLLAKMKTFYTDYLNEPGNFLPEGYEIDEIISFQRQKVKDRKSRYAVCLQEKYRGDFVGARLKEMEENR